MADKRLPARDFPARLHPAALLIGYGNDLRSDDGAGVHVAMRLSEQATGMACRPGLRVAAVPQLTPELAHDLASVTQVIFVDAYAADDPDAALRIERIGNATAGTSSPPALDHRLDPTMLLDLTDRIYGRTPEAWVVGIPAFRFDFGETISAPTSRGIDAAVSLLGGCLKRASGMI